MLLVVLNTIIIFSKPVKTYMMKIFYVGETFAFITMILHITMLGCTIEMGVTHNSRMFNLFYVLFCISFVMTLDFLLFYLNNLSFRRRLQRKYTVMQLIVFSAVWHFLLVRPLIQDKLLVFENGRYTMSRESDVYVTCAIICVILAGAIMFSNRKHVSKVVYLGTIIFLPLVLIGVASQFYFRTAYFVCATFTTPYLIFFILHHVAKYDELTGCQGITSYRYHLQRLLDAGREFIVFSVISPIMERGDIGESNDTILYLYNYLSRKVEQVDYRIKVYQISSFNYRIICPVRNKDESKRIKRQLMEIFMTPVQIQDSEFTPSLHMLIAPSFREITNVDEYLSLLNHQSRNFKDTASFQVLTVRHEDVTRFKRRLFIEQNLREIKQRNNLDDERILLYIQPIFKISANDFRTGETLVRMQIDGEQVYPDEFIPLAEEIDLIHVFTRIMLHKAAKQTVLMRDTCDFDALTVNVSTMELTHPGVWKEFLQIITDAGAKPENIRLEITESTSITDYTVIIENIKKLVEEGISFYLDDFGTGYSNLDRVLGIPFKTIKFDKSFMLKAMEDKRSEELFNLMVMFCKKNGFTTVVEGVETIPQKEFVEKAGFEYIQGYLYSRPLPAEQAMKFFQ